MTDACGNILCPEIHDIRIRVTALETREEAILQRLADGAQDFREIREDLDSIQTLLQQGLLEQAQRDGAAVERQKARDRRDFWLVGLLGAAVTVLAALV